MPKAAAPADLIAAYLHQIRRTPLLSREEALNMAWQVQAWLTAENPTPAVVAAEHRARRKLIEANLWLVVAIANGAHVEIDGLSIDHYITSTIAALVNELPNVPAKSKEGVAGTLLRYLEFHEKLHPQSFEAVVDKLLGHPDFDPQKLVALLKQRYVKTG